MIKNWDEIQKRYDKIKNHKPKAVKKLNELGDILSSAYAINPIAASEMWQYIIDLNITDDIKFSKFYIAQVFNKLSDRMEYKDATSFLTMNPERVRLMIMYGYDGGTLWHCLFVLLEGYIVLKDVKNAMICMNHFYSKFGGIQSDNPQIIKTVIYAARICVNYIKSGENEEISKKILMQIGNSVNEDINASVQIICAINSVGSEFDFEVLFNAAKKHRLNKEFFDLLWAARNVYNIDELRDKWVEHIENCKDDEEIPKNYIVEDNDECDYKNSKLKFYVDMEKTSDKLLDYYFNRERVKDAEEGVIWAWIEERDWNRFTCYVSKILKNTLSKSFMSSDIKWHLDNYMSACFNNNSRTYYGRSYNKLMKHRGQEFCDALAKISSITIGWDVHDNYHAYIKSFIQKYSGSVESLNSVGFNDVMETAEERLKAYIHDFLLTGETIHNNQSVKYDLIIKSLHDEMYGINNENDSLEFEFTFSKKDLKLIACELLGIEYDILENILDEDEEDEDEDKIDEKMECYYRLALDDEVATFYFTYYPNEDNMRADLLSACIKKGDFERAVELIDMMIEFMNSEKYKESNLWKSEYIYH